MGHIDKQKRIVGKIPKKKEFRKNKRGSLYAGFLVMIIWQDL
jgi:hypothetical protein